MSADTGRDASADTRDDERDADDDALSWGSSSDRSYVEGPAVPQALPPELADDEDDEDDDELPEGVMSSAALVAHGVFAAILLLYTVAWLISVTRATPPSLAGVSLALWHVGQWLAVAAPAAWFVTTIAVTPLRPGRRRYLWFLAAVLVLIPWQFIVGGAA